MVKTKPNKTHKKIKKTANMNKDVKVIFGSILDRLEAIEKELSDMTQFFEEIVTKLYGEEEQPQEPESDKKPSSQYIS